MFSKEESIYGSEETIYDNEERNACAIQRFSGILAKQLLMMGQRLKVEERKRKREEWRRMVASNTSSSSDDFASSQESNTVWINADEEAEVEEDDNEVGRGEEGVTLGATEGEEGGEEIVLDELNNNSQRDDRKKGGEVIIVSFRDRMGNLHEARKYPMRMQSTNKRWYTPARVCSIDGCDAKTRVYCKQCKLPYCYKLVGQNWEETNGDDGNDGESCFAKHVRDIRRKSGRS
jgi:hypothetical protein